MHPLLSKHPIRRIAVFRALVLGDMLCATPALRALKAAWPDAELTLIGLPWARELAERLPSVDRFEAFPGWEGLPEITPDRAEQPAFLARMRAASFDLLVQLHGSGSIVNPLLADFGARRVAGFAEPGDFSADPALHTVWPKTGHEIERLLHLVDHLGIDRQGRQLDLPLTDGDRERLRDQVPELAEPAGDGFVCVHPGAQLPSRRWLPRRFAEVADRLAAAGLLIVLTGGANEAAIAAEVRSLMKRPALDLTGRTDLFSLGALVERARLVVCNDTGILHVAAAVGTPSIAVSSGADVARWAPLDTVRHRVFWQDLPCRPCAFRECPYNHECAVAVAAGEVGDAAAAALGLD